MSPWTRLRGSWLLESIVALAAGFTLGLLRGLEVLDLAEMAVLAWLGLTVIATHAVLSLDLEGIREFVED